MLRPRDPRLEVQALGMRFRTPVGLAAGVDSDGRWLQGLSMLGFGFIEVGTVTAKAQRGNERPRVFRLLSEHAILNRRGFPNDGAAAAAKRLRAARITERPQSGRGGAESGSREGGERASRRGSRPIVGVNIGKSAVTALEDAGADYRESARAVAALADYLVLNVSSPNTPRLRELQSVAHLRQLIEEVRGQLSALQVEVPLLVKIAPDLSDEEIAAIADLAVSMKLDGIVAVNTTTDRTCLEKAPPVPPEFGGGISGRPLRPRAEQVLALLADRVGEQLALISVGGIESAEDVISRLQAGATLVQAHTAFVFNGPLWPFSIAKALSRKLDEAGVRDIADLSQQRRASSERR